MPGYKKPPKSGQFVKGDPRINRSGRPKKLDILREIFEKKGNEDIDNFMLPNTSCIEAIAHDWLNSSDYRKQRAALEIIFGYSSFLEKNETRRLGLNDMSLEYINNILIPRYKSLGLNINRCEEFNNNENSINTTWMKKLLYLRNKHNIRERNIYYLSFSKNN